MELNFQNVYIWYLCANFTSCIPSNMHFGVSFQQMSVSLLHAAHRCVDKTESLFYRDVSGRDISIKVTVVQGSLLKLF